ncbi:MAG: hypothetical protein KDD45_04065 [Bdellovibrionales bacterium]|nr:hypothetical protein [Bdellovibrionales bacterium]
MSYLNTSDHAEIDLIIERPKQKTILVEIKSTDRIQSLNEQKMRGFKGLIKDFKNSEAYLQSRDKTELSKDGIQFIYWKNIFQKINLITSEKIQN